jgi:GNAT superfamily N-acetyltransferase
MLANDVSDVAHVHLSAFSGFFLSIMGAYFLSAFYRAALQDENSIAFSATLDGKLVGFVVGTAAPISFYKRILSRHWFYLGITALLRIFTCPNIIPRLWRRLREAGHMEYSTHQTLLMSIAVSPAAQGRGVGKVLLEAFVQASREKESVSVCLLTDRIGNDRTNSFYQQAGFECQNFFTTAEGRQMNIYSKNISE